MRRLLILILIVPCLLIAIGQNKSDQKLIDSLNYELYKANARANYYQKKMDTLEYLLKAKELAQLSIELKDTLQALVALQAYKFWTSYKGKPVILIYIVACIIH